MQDAIFLHFSFEKGSILVNQFADLMICVCVGERCFLTTGGAHSNDAY